MRDVKVKIQQKENLDEKSIQTWIDRIESNRKKSYKSMQDHANLSDTDTIYASNCNKFMKQDPVHLLDICSGKIEHLNLKNIVSDPTTKTKICCIYFIGRIRKFTVRSSC